MTNPFDPSVVVTVDESSRVSQARRIATTLGGHIGLDEEQRGKLALVVTEAATNLLKHAGGGDLIVQGIECWRGTGVEILAVDKGPGIGDVSRSMTDGFSTAGSAGNGLGAIARLSDDFDLHSHPGLGTALLARLWSASLLTVRKTPGLEVDGVSVAYPGETVCGDGWSVVETPDQSLTMVVDGLGHGRQAAEAARDAIEVFRAQADRSPAEILGAAHSALRSTRGAAMAIALVDRRRDEVRFAGVGNIAAVLLDPRSGRTTSMVSRNGIVGHTMHKVQEFTYPWARDLLLVMNSDGLTSHWQLERYPGLMLRSPGLIAGVLYRDFKRGRDDVTVLVARDGEASP